jgi:hypothetical protein
MLNPFIANNSSSKKKRTAQDAGFASDAYDSSFACCPPDPPPNGEAFLRGEASIYCHSNSNSNDNPHHQQQHHNLSSTALKKTMLALERTGEYWNGSSNQCHAMLTQEDANRFWNGAEEGLAHAYQSQFNQYPLLPCSEPHLTIVVTGAEQP